MSAVAECYIKIAADVSELRSQLSSMGGEIQKQLESLRKSSDATSFFTRILAGKTVFGMVGDAIHGAVGFVREFVDAAAQAEVSTALLGVTITNLGQKIGYTADEFDNIIRKTQLMGVASLGQVQDAARTIMQSGMIRGQNFQGTLELMQDMGAAMGGVEHAAHMLGHALANPEHGLMLLRRAGMGLDPQFQQNIKMMLEMGQTAQAQAAIIDRLKTAYHGYAEALRNTFTGQMQIIGNEIQQAKVQLGQAFLPTLKEVAKAVQDFLQGDTWKYWVQLVKGALADVIQFLKGMAQSILPSFEGVKDGITGILETLATVVHNPELGFDVAWVAIKAGFTDVIVFLLDALHNISPAATSVWQAIADAFVLAMNKAIDATQKRLNDILPAWAKAAGPPLQDQPGGSNYKPWLTDDSSQNPTSVAASQAAKSQEDLKTSMQDLIKQWHGTSTDLHAEMAKLLAEFEKGRNDVKNRGRQGVPPPPKDVGPGTPSEDYGQKAMKYQFEGIAALSKQIQQSITGGDIRKTTEQIAGNTAKANELLAQIAAGVGMAGQKEPAIAGPG